MSVALANVFGLAHPDGHAFFAMANHLVDAQGAQEIVDFKISQALLAASSLCRS